MAVRADNDRGNAFLVGGDTIGLSRSKHLEGPYTERHPLQVGLTISFLHTTTLISPSPNQIGAIDDIR